MNIPTLPTDNLYKFMSIFGLILLISNFALFVYDARNRDKQHLEYEVLKYKIYNDNLAISQDIEYKKHENNSEKIARYIFSKEREIALKNAEYWKINTLESQNLKDRDTLWFVSLVICFISIGLICYGFKMWKTKLQVYQDEIIKNEAERSKLTEKSQDNQSVV